MIQIKNLNLIHQKDYRVLLDGFNLVLNNGDKAVIIGEEGDGKSTLLKWIYNPQMVEGYIEAEGEKIHQGEKLAYLPQELSEAEADMTLYEFFSNEHLFFNQSPKELAALSSKFCVDFDFFYGNQKMKSLSGGEKIKAQLMRLLISSPTVLLLDEPSNDVDIETVELLETVICEWKGIVLFVSHDEMLIKNTANVVIHIEQVMKKQKNKYEVLRDNYENYILSRQNQFERQKQQAQNELRAKKERDDKLHRLYSSVNYRQANLSKKGSDTKGRLLKKKMHAVKAMERRFEKEDSDLTKMPDEEVAIYLKLNRKDSFLPQGKDVISYELDKLYTPDRERILAQNVRLDIQGAQKICIIGPNGCGKTTLLKEILTELSGRSDIKVAYMPQNYDEDLDVELTPVDYLDQTGDKETRTRVRQYLGAMKYTTEEMCRPIRELSGGQKAKLIFLRISLSGANVLVLDEPTRNISPLSSRVIREALHDYGGAIISVSHDRQYMRDVCNRFLLLTTQGLKETVLN